MQVSSDTNEGSGTFEAQASLGSQGQEHVRQEAGRENQTGRLDHLQNREHVFALQDSHRGRRIDRRSARV